MSNELVPIVFRLPQSLIERFDRLTVQLANDPRLARHGRLTRAALIRECLAECADRWEKEQEVKSDPQIL